MYPSVVLCSYPINFHSLTHSIPLQQNSFYNYGVLLHTHIFARVMVTIHYVEILLVLSVGRDCEALMGVSSMCNLKKKNHKPNVNQIIYFTRNEYVNVFACSFVICFFPDC